MAHGRADEVRRFTSIRTGLGVLTGGERRVQLVVALALMAGLAYLTWRLAFTLDGAPRWLELPLIAAEGWGFLPARLTCHSGMAGTAIPAAESSRG